jgi:hypothetical protein
MQRDLASATKIANNTAISCEKLLSTEEDTVSGPPISIMTARATAAGKQECEYLTSW